MKLHKGFIGIIAVVVVALLVGGTVTYVAVSKKQARMSGDDAVLKDRYNELVAEKERLEEIINSTEPETQVATNNPNINNPNVQTTTIYVPLVTESIINQVSFMNNPTARQVAYDTGAYLGCGSAIFYMPIQIPYTQQVLNATYQKLFSLPESVTYQGKTYQNIIASASKTLNPNTAYSSPGVSFDRVEIFGRTANVYLTGNMRSNHCADPALLAQFRFTGTYYPTVDDVVIYLNNALFDAGAWQGSDAGV